MPLCIHQRKEYSVFIANSPQSKQKVFWRRPYRLHLHCLDNDCCNPCGGVVVLNKRSRSNAARPGRSAVTTSSARNGLRNRWEKERELRPGLTAEAEALRRLDDVSESEPSVRRESCEERDELSRPLHACELQSSLHASVPLLAKCVRVGEGRNNLVELLREVGMCCSSSRCRTCELVVPPGVESPPRLRMAVSGGADGYPRIAIEKNVSVHVFNPNAFGAFGDQFE